MTTEGRFLSRRTNSAMTSKWWWSVSFLKFFLEQQTEVHIAFFRLSVSKNERKSWRGKKNTRRQVYRCRNSSNCCAPHVRCFFPAHSFPLFSSNLEPSSTSLCSCSSVWFIWMDTTLLQVLGYETNCLKKRLWEKWKKARSTSDTNFSSKVI